MRIAVIDDVREDSQGLRDQLGRYFSERRLKADIEDYSSAPEFWAAFSAGRYQIVFLDIFMEPMSGMELAREIYAHDPECRLIFFTTSFDYAVESYEVRAAYYLTKPVQYQKLCDALDSCCGELMTESKYLTTRVGQMDTIIRFRDILYIDCVNRKVFLHLEDRILALSDSLKDIALQLEDDVRFLSCNRGIMVNMDWIQNIRNDAFLLKTGEEIPIRVRGRAAVKKSFLEYSLRNLRKE